jgi:hypothetical protein
MPTCHRPLHAQRRFRVVLLVLAMLVAQTLGLVHAHLHPAGHAAEARHDDHAFGHEAGGTECRLFDQIGHDWALAAPWALAADLPTRSAAHPMTAAAPIAAQAAGYLARGPPRRFVRA